jgi:plasmid stabilization system protein ParE
VVSRIEFHPDASEEADEARKWYAERSPVAELAFLTELNHAVELVAENPETWPEHESGTRRYVFPRFPYSLIYRFFKARIQIIAVAHAKRKPGYWKDR